MKNMIIQSGQHVASDLHINGDVIILGSYSGILYCEGNLFIEETGQVEGEAHVFTANIKGCFKGFLEAQKHVIFGNHAKFQGVLDTSNAVTVLGTELVGEIRVRSK